MYTILKIILKDCHDPFSEPNKEEWFIKNMPYEKIIVSGKGYISTEALSILSENNRNVILLDTYGKPITFCNGMMDSLTATRYRMAQYDTFRDESKRQYLEKQIISAKKESQLKLLKLIGSDIEHLPEKEVVEAIGLGRRRRRDDKGSHANSRCHADWCSWTGRLGE